MSGCRRPLIHVDLLACCLAFWRKEKGIERNLGPYMVWLYSTFPSSLVIQRVPQKLQLFFYILYKL